MLFDDFNFLPETHLRVEVARLAHNPLTGYDVAGFVHDHFFDLLRDTRSHQTDPTRAPSGTTATMASASADNSIYVVGYKITSDDPAAGEDLRIQFDHIHVERGWFYESIH